MTHVDTHHKSCANIAVLNDDNFTMESWECFHDVSWGIRLFVIQASSMDLGLEIHDWCSQIATSPSVDGPNKMTIGCQDRGFPGPHSDLSAEDHVSNRIAIHDVGKETLINVQHVADSEMTWSGKSPDCACACRSRILHLELPETLSRSRSRCGVHDQDTFAHGGSKGSEQCCSCSTWFRANTPLLINAQLIHDVLQSNFWTLWNGHAYQYSWWNHVYKQMLIATGCTICDDNDHPTWTWEQCWKVSKMTHVYAHLTSTIWTIRARAWPFLFPVPKWCIRLQKSCCTDLWDLSPCCVPAKWVLIWNQHIVEKYVRLYNRTIDVCKFGRGFETADLIHWFRASPILFPKRGIPGSWQRIGWGWAGCSILILDVYGHENGSWSRQLKRVRYEHVIR